MTQLEKTQAELIELLEGQLIQLTVTTKVELGDDVLKEIKRLTFEIDKMTRAETN